MGTYDWELELKDFTIYGEVELGSETVADVKVRTVSVDKYSMKIIACVGFLGDVDITDSLDELQLDLCIIKLKEHFITENEIKEVAS